MRIGQTTESLQADQIARTNNRGTSGAGALRETAAVGTTDRVELSNTSKALVAADAPIDSAKIEAIRKAINSGTYKPDPTVMADKMINEAAELFERIAGGNR